MTDFRGKETVDSEVIPERATETESEETSETQGLIRMQLRVSIKECLSRQHCFGYESTIKFWKSSSSMCLQQEPDKLQLTTHKCFLPPHSKDPICCRLLARSLTLNKRIVPPPS